MRVLAKKQVVVHPKSVEVIALLDSLNSDVAFDSVRVQVDGKLTDGDIFQIALDAGYEVALD